MQINVKGKNFEVTEALQSYLDKKLSKLEKHFKSIKSATAVLSIQRGMHIVEVSLEGDGIVLRGEERRGTDMYGSIDQVIEKLESRVQKFKGKRIGRAIDDGPKDMEVTRDQARTEAYGEENPEADNDGVPTIVRLKRFALKPLTPEEAAERMELLHHNFYVFRNSENESVCVVYKRDDGNYGLIEPA